MMLFYWFYRIYWKHLFILNAFIIVFMFYFIMFIFPLYSNFLSFIWLPQGQLLATVNDAALLMQCLQFIMLQIQPESDGESCSKVGSQSLAKFSVRF